MAAAPASVLPANITWTENADTGVFDDIETVDVEPFVVEKLATKMTPLPAVRYIEDPDSADEKELLVVSPYTSRSHLLDLSTVNLECQLLARALTSMRPVRTDYATAPYDAAFNWSAVVDYLRCLLLSERHRFRASRFYIVVFRSQVPRSTDRTRLGVLDELAHAEATESGGLLKYWFGNPDKNGRNLATCLWRDRNDARLGGRGPGHAKAMQETKALYLEWHVERLSLNISKDAQSWTIETWQD